eukprot:m.485440 g.485440  ORF g.485440 m.485440 type:complete len:748 (+) comp57207_c0_seq6:326-2569(+)
MDQGSSDPLQYLDLSPEFDFGDMNTFGGQDFQTSDVWAVNTHQPEYHQTFQQSFFQPPAPAWMSQPQPQVAHDESAEFLDDCLETMIQDSPSGAMDHLTYDMFFPADQQQQQQALHQPSFGVLGAPSHPPFAASQLASAAFPTAFHSTHGMNVSPSSEERFVPQGFQSFSPVASATGMAQHKAREFGFMPRIKSEFDDHAFTETTPGGMTFGTDSDSRPQSPDSVHASSRANSRSNSRANSRANSRPTSPVFLDIPRRFVSTHSGPTRVIRINDGKHVYEAELDANIPMTALRNIVLEHRPRDSHAALVILTERVPPKRMSDTGSYEPSQLLPMNDHVLLSDLPALTNVFIYELCQGQPLRGEPNGHFRLCHPKSTMCEAHRKQMERAKTRKPEVMATTSRVLEEPKRRRTECLMSFEVLLGDVCPLGQELLGMLTSYSPMRTQIRQMLSESEVQHGPMALLSLRWPRCWANDRLLGFDANSTLVKFCKSATYSARQVAVRSRMAEEEMLQIPTNYKINLDASWQFGEHLAIDLMTIEGPSPAKVRVLGMVRGEITTLTEFWLQGNWAPMLFVPSMKGQRDAFDVIMVVVESASTGAPLAHQIIKLSDPRTWSRETAFQWIQLVERKLLSDGTLEPHTSWAGAIRNAFAPSSDLNLESFFGRPVRTFLLLCRDFLLLGSRGLSCMQVSDSRPSVSLCLRQDASLLRFGFSMRDVGRLADEVLCQSRADSLTDPNEFCIRKSVASRRA